MTLPQKQQGHPVTQSPNGWAGLCSEAQRALAKTSWKFKSPKVPTGRHLVTHDEVMGNPSHPKPQRGDTL